MRIGLISDTHGRLRSSVFAALDGVQLILHAGDIGHPGIITELEVIAPVQAVHGNTDGFDIRALHPEVRRLTVDERLIVLTHGHTFGTPTPPALRTAFPDADVIVFGHTHRPEVDRSQGVLVVNPGAAGPARFRLKPSVAILRLEGDVAEVEERPLPED